MSRIVAVELMKLLGGRVKSWIYFDLNSQSSNKSEILFTTKSAKILLTNFITKWKNLWLSDKR
jgi:hypothetical protein